MNSKRIFSFLAVALMVFSCCACLVGGGVNSEGSSTKVVTNATPIEIDSNGNLVGIDEATLESEYGATYSKTNATLTFNEDCDITASSSATFFIKSATDITMTVNCILIMTENGTEDKDPFICINADEKEIKLKGNGSLVLNTNTASMGIKAEKCTINSIGVEFFVGNTSGNFCAINTENTNTSEIEIKQSTLSVKYNEESDNSLGTFYGLSSNKITIDGCLIDISTKGSPTSSISTYNGDNDSITLKNSVIVLKAISDNSPGTCIFSNKTLTIENCDIDLISGGTGGKGDNPYTIGAETVNITGSNLRADAIDKIVRIKDTTKFVLDGTRGTDYVLLDENGATYTDSVQNFIGTKKGEIHNLKVKINYSLDEECNDAPPSVTKEHGTMIPLPSSDAKKGNLVVVGWTDGFKTYKVGEEYKASISITLKAVFAPGPSSNDSTVMTVAVSTIFAIPVILILLLIFWDRRDED